MVAEKSGGPGPYPESFAGAGFINGFLRINGIITSLSVETETQYL
jgi:hypothetical protein